MKAIIRKLGRAGDLRMGKTLGTKQKCLRDLKSQKSENRQTAVHRSRTRALLHNGRGPGMVHTSNPGTYEAGVSEPSLAYVTSSRTARATIWDSVSKENTKQNKKTSTQNKRRQRNQTRDNFSHWTHSYWRPVCQTLSKALWTWKMKNTAMNLTFTFKQGR